MWHYTVIAFAIGPCCLMGYGTVSLASSAQMLRSKSQLMAFCDMREILIRHSVLYFLEITQLKT